MGSYIRWFENSPAPVTFGEERGDIRVLWNSPTTLVYIAQGELTGDFGEERGDIRVFWNSPRWLWRGARGYHRVNVIEPTGAGDFGDLEERDKIVSFDKRKVCINPTNTTYFCWHFHSIFAQTYFLFAFVEKKHVAVGLIGNKFSRQFRKNMWFSKSPAPVTCIIIYVFATSECTG